ncbi:unnamed protein product [Adineta steineri]|uniref:VCBS repeat-containing protein n=1 Tax=Adineta steineri TaxID=433720 RepID=A0A819TVB3_9BILA|nr:unnamed protein product [Adineta steineri]CAF4083799.1 unnamed protein product [Adineta steineri]
MPTPTTSTMKKSICQLDFQSILTNISHPCSRPGRPFVADFNGDNQLDFAFYCQASGQIIVLFGNGSGSFKTEKTFSTKLLDPPAHIAVGDFNNDNRSDLAITYYDGEKKVYILLANDNEMFELTTILTIEGYNFLTDISVGDFNGDKYLDIVVGDFLPASIIIFVGYGDGSFSMHTMLSSVPSSESDSFAIVDFNDDGQLDIAVTNENSTIISIYFGRGDGTFVQKWYYSGPLFSKCSILADDFNSDTRIDLLCYNSQKNLIGLMAGYGNGSFEPPKWSNVSDISPLSLYFKAQETIYFGSDYNCDDHADIISYRRDSAIFGLLGQGNGNFEQQPILSPIVNEHIGDIAVGDFDNDNYQDILAIYKYPAVVKILLNRCECCKLKKL